MGIFRKSSIERLASPEEIDQLMRITGAREWLALGAVFLLLIAAGVWSVRGSVATTVAGQGVIVREGGVRNVVTSGAGVLEHLNVRLGERIHRNQVVASLDQPATEEKVALARRALDEAQTVRADTFRLNSIQSRLQIEAIEKRETNAREQIARLQDQIKLANEQVTVQEALQSKGLVTRRQVVEARQQMAALQTDLANRQAEINQLESDRFGWGKRPTEQDQLTRQRILELQARLTEVEEQSRIEGSVISPYDGEVIELKASAGERVPPETPVLSLQPSLNNLEVVAYISSLRAKEIRNGMEVQVSPSIVKREEYGFLRGRVVSVAAFPATRAALMRNFENENLLAAFASDAPVTELRIEMEGDPSTVSGFRWSSAKGPPILLSGGMLCGVQVVTLRQRPAALVLPFLRHQAGAN